MILTFDMPDRVCGKCGTNMNKNGLEHSVATFLDLMVIRSQISISTCQNISLSPINFVGEIFGEENILCWNSCD